MGKTIIDEEVDELFGDYGKPTKEQQELADKLTEVFVKARDAYAEAFNINERLEFDDALMDEYYTTLSMLTLMEAGEKEHDDMEMVEHGYLKAIDCMIRLAKVIHPISGFGADRLKLAYEIIDTFEEVYHPLITLITKKNIDAFLDLLSDKEYDEIYFGRKKAIGALRLDGKDTYAAGVAVYRDEQDPVFETPIRRLDYIYVHEDFRSFGTGNLLMATVIRPMLDNPESRLTVNFIPIGTTDEDKEEYATAIEDEFDRTEEFLSSWKLDFSIEFSNEYYVTVEDVPTDKFINATTKGIISLKKLEDRTEHMFKKFFKQLDNADDLLSTPLDYYDPDVSCIYSEGNEIHAMLLCHHYIDGSYTLNIYSKDIEDKEILKDSVSGLVHFAYDACTKRGDSGSMVEIIINSEEGFSLLRKLVPNAKAMLTFSGLLSPLDPDETVSSDDWELLRKEAGLTDKYEFDENETDDITEEELHKQIDEHLKSYM